MLNIPVLTSLNVAALCDFKQSLSAGCVRSLSDRSSPIAEAIGFAGRPPEPLKNLSPPSSTAVKQKFKKFKKFVELAFFNVYSRTRNTCPAFRVQNSTYSDQIYSKKKISKNNQKISQKKGEKLLTTIKIIA